MSIYPKVCLYSGGSWSRWIPPFNLSVDVEPVFDTVIHVLPFARQRSGYNRVIGYTINVAAKEIAASTASALSFKQSLRSALLTDYEIPKTVEISRWIDSSSLIGEVYRSCECIAGPTFPDGNGRSLDVDFNFRLTCMDPTIYQNAADGTQPGTSPYESYFLTKAGGTPAVPINQIYSYQVIFTGLLEVTDADNVDRMQSRFYVLGPAAHVMHIRSIQAIKVGSLNYVDSISSIIKISDAAWDGAGNTIALTLGRETGVSARATGDLEITAGSPAYVFVTQAGGHGDLIISVEVQSG